MGSLILVLLFACTGKQGERNAYGNSVGTPSTFDTLNLPKISHVEIRFDKDTNDFHLKDTIKVDIKIPGISDSNISLACTKAKWIIDYRLDSFKVSLFPVRTGEMDLYIYLRNDTNRYVTIGVRKYTIKE